MATINASSSADIIVPSNNGTTYRGLGGDDTYIISNAASGNITIVDTSGSNTIQLVDGLSIASSKFAADSVQLTLSNGAVITVNGADKFSFDIGGNTTSGVTGTSKDYAGLAADMGVASLPTGSTISDGGAGTVSGAAISTGSISYTLSADSSSVAEGEAITYTVTASSAPSSDVTLTYNVKGDDNGGTVEKAANADIASLSGSVVIAAGSTSATFTVTPNVDGDNEGLEGIKVSVFDSNNGIIGSESALISNTVSASATTSNLTTGTDTIDGGSGTNTIGGVVYGALGTGTTFQPGDVIDGGDGTDTLKLNLSGTLTADYTISGIEVKNVENLEVNSFQTANGFDHTVDLALATGYTSLGLNSSAATGDIVWDNVKEKATVIAKTGGADQTVTYAAALTAGAADTQHFEVNGYTGNTTVAGVETISINSTGTKSTGSITTTAATSLTITGDAKLTLSNTLPQLVLAVDASSFTGGFSLVMNPTAAAGTAVTGGSGNDTLNLGSAMTSITTFDGGAGIDTLKITDAADITPTKSAGISNVEILGATAADTDQFVANTITGLIGVASYADDPNDTADATEVVFSYLSPESANIYLYTDEDVAATMAVDTSADVGNVYVGSAVAVADVNVVDFTGNDFETINLTSSALSPTQGHTFDNFGGSDLKTLNISGNGITITAWNGATKLTTIDATGAYKLTMSAANPAGALYPDTIKGSGTADTLRGGTAASTIEGNGGADTIYGGAGGDTIKGGAGADILYGDAGSDTIHGDDGADYIYAGSTTSHFEDLAVAETVDGGAGTDVLFFNAASATITAADIANVSNVELFYFSGNGADTITFNDTYFTNAGATSQIVRDFAANGAIDSFTVTASSLSAANSVTTQHKLTQAVTESLTGGAGDDNFQFTTNVATILVTSDTVNGGKGDDTLKITVGSAELTQAVQSGVTNVETIEFAGTAGIAVNYTLADGTFVTTSLASTSGNGTTAAIVGTVDASGMTGSGILTFVGSAEDDSKMVITGGNGADILTGGTKADTISGGSGADTINGDGGIDVLNGNDGNDIFDVVATALADFIGLTNAETVDGGSGTDVLKFSKASATTVAASDLSGIKSIEQITFAGGSNDSITLSDTVFSNNGNASLRINASNAGTLTVAAGGLSTDYSINVRPSAASVTETITGGNGNDTVQYSDASALDTADTITGGVGTDALIVLTAGNAHTATYTNIATIESITYSLANTSATINATLADGNFVNLDSAPITATAITSAVTIDASAENDSTVDIKGGTAGDTLTGTDTYLTLSGDTISGGNGADTIDGSLGGDTISGGAGADTFVYNDVTDSASLPDSITDFLSGTDKLKIALNYSSSTQDLIVTGDVTTGKTSKSAVQDALTGTRGQATYNTETSQLYVNYNNDNLITSLDYTIGLNAGATALTTVADADIIWNITTGSGADTVTGNVGADIISTGTGIDTVFSGRGIDTVQLGASDGADDIYKLSTQELYSSATTATSGSVAVDVVSGFEYGASADQVEISITAIEALGGVTDLTDGDGASVTADSTDIYTDAGDAIYTLGTAATTVLGITIAGAMTEAVVEAALINTGTEDLTSSAAGHSDGDAMLLLVDSTGEASVGTVLALMVFLSDVNADTALTAGTIDIIFLANLGTADATGSANTANFDLIA